MRVEQLAYFLAIVECGSIRAAAQRLGLSQPAVSNAIKNLENELGQRLFLRTAQGVRLSQYGENIIEDVKHIVVHADAIKKMETNTEKSIIRLCAPPVVTSFLTKNLLILFKEMHPNLEVHTFNTAQQDMPDTIREKNIDIALTTRGLGERHGRQTLEMGCKVAHLFTDTRKIFISARNIFAGKDSLGLEELQHLSIIYYSANADSVSAHYARHIPFAREYRLANRDDILNLVLRDEGAFIQPERLFSLDDRIRSGLILPKTINVPGVDNAAPVFAILCRPSPSPPVLHLWNFLLQQFRQK